MGNVYLKFPTIEDKDNPKVTNDIFLFIILPPINQSFYLIIFLKLKLILKILLYNMLSVL